MKTTPTAAASPAAALSPITTAKLDELVIRTQATGRVPALAAVVVRRGEVAHLSLAGTTPVPTGDTQFRIGSITKTMTAALVLRLRDEGRLGLDDPLGTHLAATDALTPPAAGLTIRHLLAHIGGVQREPDGPWWERHAGTDVATLLAGVGPEKLAWPAPHGFHYSNLAYGLLGAVVQAHEKRTWFETVRERLLRPLGLGRTTYQAEAPFAAGYVVHPWHHTLREEPRHDHGAMAPAGQLWSTTADLAKWAAFLAEPDPQVLAAASVAQMCAPAVIADPDGWTAGHGLGLQLWRFGERVYVGHTGSMPGYLAVLVVHRPSRTGVVAFANAYRITGTSILGLGASLLGTVLDHEPAEPPAPWRPAGGPPDPQMAEVCGRWWWMGAELEARWQAETGELVLAAPHPSAAAVWRFVPEGPDRWRGVAGSNDGEILRAVRDDAGAVTQLNLATYVLARDPARA